jgi:CelD/BcsL family acetyltransferase involved in cellulose biosynthesis
MALSVRAIRDFDAPGLAETWARLSATSPAASVFSSYAWARCWWETTARGARPAVLQLADEAGAVRGLLPACRERQGPVRWLKLMGRERVSGDHLDLLCAPADHAAAVDALADWLEGGGEFDGLLLGELPAAGATVERLRTWATRRGHALIEREPQVVPYADLPRDCEAFIAGLSANMRYHVRRRRRELDRQDGAVRTLTARADVLAALERLFVLHAARWAQAGARGNLHAAEKQEFLRRFCGTADAARATVLEVGRDIVGVLLAFCWRETTSFYQMGWDPATTIQSPGVLLLAESIANAIAAGCTRYDFLRGDEEYKRRWTTAAVHQTTLLIGWRAPASAAIALERVKARVRSGVQRTLGPAAWTGLKQLVGRAGGA